MPVSTLYDSYVPNTLRLLDSLDAVLTKGENYAKEKGIDANAEYLGASIYEDMKPLPFQIYTVTRLAKLSVTNMTGAEPGDWEGDESLKSFDDLHARIERARALLKSTTPEQYNGREDDQVEMKLGPRAFQVKAHVMLFQLVQPNLYFHLVTAYNILRSKGVPLSKLDYLGSFADGSIPPPPGGAPKQ